jgi:two-component system phosphate regulon sensor histidine kinase PhoR
MQENKEKNTFIWVIIAAIVVGLSVGYIWQTIILALFIYIIYLINNLTKIHNWLKNGAIIEDEPVLYGDFSKITNSVVKLQNKHKLTKKLHQKSIVRFNEVLRSFPYPTVIVNASSEIVWVGKSAAKILKLNRKKDIGIRINNIIRNLDFEEKLSSKETSEVQILAPIDENIILSIAISKVSKNVRILSIRDVSERRYLEKTRKNFIANASHELRTPLTVISGYLQMLSLNEEIKDFDKNLKTMIDSAYSQSKLMSVLIEDLLTLSNLEGGKLQNIKIKTISVKDLTSDVLSSFDDNPEYKNRISVNVDKKLQIKGVYSQIYSIVFNLLENALKYSEKEVNLNFIVKNDLATLQVIDKGVNLNEDEKLKIIEPFYRLNQNQDNQAKDSKIPGTGLGLSIVNQAAINNNAKLKITNNNNQGSIFSVDFEKFLIL